MKRILIFLITLLTVEVSTAQVLNTNPIPQYEFGRALLVQGRFRTAQDTLSNIGGYNNPYISPGGLFGFKTGSFYGHNGTLWLRFLTQEDSIILNNKIYRSGLTKLYDTIRLGGLLDNSTTITLGAHNFSYKTSSGDSVTYGSLGYGGTPSISSSNWLTLLLKGKFLMIPMPTSVPDALDAFPRIQIGVNRTSGYSRLAKYSAVIEAFTYSGQVSDPAVDSNRNKPFMIVTTGFNGAAGGAGDIILRPGVTTGLGSNYDTRYGNFHVKLEPSGTGTVKTPYKQGLTTDSVMVWRAVDSSMRMMNMASLINDTAAAGTLYFENGATSTDLDSLLTSPNGSTIVAKAIGTVGRTFINVTKTKGTDSIKWTVGMDTAALRTWIVDSIPTPTLLFDSIGTGTASLYTSGDTLRTRLFDSSYAFTWAPTGSMIGTIDTNRIATRAWALGNISGGGGGTPGGTDTQVQFNDAGAFGGDAGFVYNKTTNTVTTDSLYLNKKVKIGSPPVDGFYNADVSIAFDGTGATAGLSIYNGAGSRILSILENGGVQWPQLFSNFGAAGITFTGDNTKVFRADAISGGRTPVFQYSSSTLSGTGSQIFSELIPTFAPSSDIVGTNTFVTLDIRPTINQTGGNDNGTRGLRISPTLTSAPNWRAIEVVSGTSNFRSINLTTAGDKISIATGTNASVGTATLVAGTVTVSTTAVTASSIIMISVNTPVGTVGYISAPAASITAGTSFVINSSSTTDTSTVNWWIIN